MDKELNVKLGAENSEFSKKIDQAKAKLNSFESSVGKSKSQLSGMSGHIKNSTSSLNGMGGSLKKMAGLMAGAFSVTAIVAFAQQSIEAYDGQVKAEQRLLFALGNRLDLQKMLLTQSEELRAKTGIDDAEIINAQTFSLAQGRSAEETKKLVEAAVDLAAVLGTNVEDAAKQLNMTYEGNIARLGRLDASLKDLTKEELENGKAIEILAAKYKGFGEASATGLDKAKSAWSEMIEASGKFIGDFGSMLIGNAGANSSWEKGTENASNFFQTIDKYAKGNQVLAVESQIKKLGKMIALTSDETIEGKSRLIIYSAELDALKKALPGYEDALAATVPRQKKLTEEQQKAAEAAAILAGDLGGLNDEIEKQNNLLLKAKGTDQIAQIKGRITELENEKKTLTELNLTLDQFYTKYGKGASVDFVIAQKTAKPEAETLSPLQMQNIAAPPAESDWWKEQEDGLKEHWDKLNAIVQTGIDNDKTIKDAATKADQDRAEKEKQIQNELSSALMSGLSQNIESYEEYKNAMADIARQLIAQYIAQAVGSYFKDLLVQFGWTGPGALAIAGAGAAAVGVTASALIPSFATGGEVVGPQLAMVGDNPGKREMIIPSEKYDSIFGNKGGSQRVQVELSGEIQARTIRLANKIGQQRYTLMTGRK